MRDYQKIVRRLEALPQAYIHRRVLGRVDGYPVYGMTLSQDRSLPTVLVMSGTHGDEPGSQEAGLAFLEADHSRWLPHMQIEVIPCLNPYGHVHDTRHNSQDVDINWAFLRDDVPEVTLVRKLIAGRRFKAVIDLHEDWESPGFYLYELTRGVPPIGQEITQRVADVLPLNLSQVIENEKARNGVIHPDLEAEKRRKGAGIPVALFQRHTDHLITTETPTHVEMAPRTRAHLIALERMMDAHCGG